MERSNTTTIGLAKQRKQSRPLRVNDLVWMLLLLLILTQCGTPQKSTSPSISPTSTSPSMVYLSDQAGVDVFQIPDGISRWKFHPQLQATTEAKFVLSRGTVYYATDHLYSLNAQTGQQNWEVTFDQEASALTVSEALVYAASTSTVYAMSVQDGSTHWHQDIQSSSWSPIDKLFLHNDFLYVSRGGSIVALDPATGTARWHFNLDPGRGDSVTDIIPVEHTHILLVQSGEALDALDERTGEVLWHQDMKVQILKVRGDTLSLIFSDLYTASSGSSI